MSEFSTVRSLKEMEDFEAVSAKQWKQKIQYDLKGKDYNESLVWQSPEGINVKPFYHPDDFKHTFSPIPGQPGSWRIAQEIFIGDAAIANKIALDAIERGAETIAFSAAKPFEPEITFKNFPFSDVSIFLNLKFLSPPDREDTSDFFGGLIDFFESKKAEVYYNVDIISHLARTGNWYNNLEKDFQSLGKLLQGNQEKNLLSVDLSLYQNAGATMVQQLAYGLAHANEYLNRFGGEEPKSFPMTFKVAIGPNYFFEIAKLRALRKLYAALAKEYGVPEVCHIFATPSRRNKTVYDFNVNLLRTTTECMSAVLGGANVVCNLAYDALYHKDNEFGQRIARNQLLILKHESYFDEVGNPADGAYFIESITDELAAKALQLFKDIEKAGGFLKQLKEGIIQRKIKETASKEQEKFNRGEYKLVGTNYHQNPDDKMKDDLELFPFQKRNPVKTIIEPILETRLAEITEQERLNSEK